MEMGESIQPQVNSWLNRIENGTCGPTGTEGREEKREEGKWRKEEVGTAGLMPWKQNG